MGQPDKGQELERVLASATDKPHIILLGGHPDPDGIGSALAHKRLCERLGVDNSGRTLHGALLDAELLADVYINMTRGQDALLMDSGSADGAGPSVVQIDLRAIELPVLAANEQEIAAHDDVLKQIDKASGSKTVWRAAAR